MRILLIGQAPFGAKVLETLLEKNETIIAVYVPPDRPGGRIDPLKQLAMDKNIPVMQPSTYKNDQVFEEYKAFKPDLTVMAFVTDIIPAHYFKIPSQGSICYHPSILPRHRGASAINWAVIMGDDKTGLTIFWPDGGIDTGPILLQKEIAISESDTTGFLYFNHLFPMGVDAIIESIELIKQGKAPRIIQDESLATYEQLCTDEVAAIDWKRPATEIYNLIRGCDPQPGAFVTFAQEKIRFFDVSLSSQTKDKAPGTILAIDEAGIQVALDSGTLLIGKVKAGKSGKIPAPEFAEQTGLKPGDRLGN